MNSHIQRLHNALIHYGYTPTVGDIIDGYPLGTQSRGQKGLPIVITYKNQKVMETVKAASIRAGFWNNRKHRNKPNYPKGFFTEAYDNLQDMHMTEDEIREVICSSKRESAAGPDGLKMAVYKEANDYLIQPLQIMFNTINHTGLIPENFKTAKVVMLHKKNSKQEMGNYRPISMSNHISKIWERVFNLRLMLHLKRHNWFSKQQHGFRPKMGCHTNLLASWEKGIDLADEHGPQIEIWSFDLQKAFDLLDHGKALELCHIAGINGKVRCLENWLTLRNQYVQCGKERSKNRIVNRSCIQGSVLGPTMWIIYIQSLLDRLENKCNYYAYADDVTLIAKIASKTEIVKFDKVLQALIIWGQEFGMRWGGEETQLVAEVEEVERIRDRASSDCDLRKTMRPKPGPSDLRNATLNRDTDARELLQPKAGPSDIRYSKLQPEKDLRDIMKSKSKPKPKDESATSALAALSAYESNSSEEERVQLTGNDTTPKR